MLAEFISNIAPSVCRLISSTDTSSTNSSNVNPSSHNTTSHERAEGKDVLLKSPLAMYAWLLCQAERVGCSARFFAHYALRKNIHSYEQVNAIMHASHTDFIALSRFWICFHRQPSVRQTLCQVFEGQNILIKIFHENCSHSVSYFWCLMPTQK